MMRGRCFFHVMLVMFMMLVVIMIMVMMLVINHVDVHGGDSVLRHVTDLERILGVKRELLQFGRQMRGRHSELQARAEKHVAAYSGKAVEIHCIHT